MRAVLLLLVMSVSACTVDVCKRAQALNTSYRQRHAACFAEGTLPAAPFDAKSCDASMNACSPADETALQGYFDCVEQLPVCTPETRAAFSTGYLACTTGMNRLSDGCFRP